MTHLEQQQIKLEEKMQESASVKFLQNVREQAEKGQSSEAMVCSTLTRQIIDNVSETLDQFITKAEKGRPGMNNNLVKYFKQIVGVPNIKKGDIMPDIEELSIDLDRICLTSISTFFDAILSKKENSKDKGFTRIALASKIGRAVRDEARWTLLQINKPEYYHFKLKDFKENHSSYIHMSKSMVFCMNRFDENTGELMFKQWGQEETIAVGVVMLEFICEALGDWVEVKHTTNNKKVTMLFNLSTEALNWINNFNKEVAGLCVAYRPMVTKPLEWTSESSGGYLTLKQPFVKRENKEEVGTIEFERIKKQVNKIQRTPWKIDAWMLDIVKNLSNTFADTENSKGDVVWYTQTEVERPMRPVELEDGFDSQNEEHIALLNKWKQDCKSVILGNLKRASKYKTQLDAVSIANQYKKFQKIYFPHNIDFRTRCYPIPGILNPQAADGPKCLIRLAKEKKLTDDGMWWLGINVANLGGVDDIALDERACWAMENLDIFRQTVADPLGNLEGWVDGDKPLQYLQAMKEYVDANDAWARGEEFFSSLPVQVDGKCNGLQHYALIMRDEKVAPEVGLIYTEQPGDIYTLVGNRAFDACVAKVELNPIAKAWVDFGIPRKIAKRPTMTCVYGSSAYGFSQQIKSELDKLSERPVGDNFENAAFLGKTINDNLEQCIGRSGAAMAFVQACVKVWCKYYNSVNSRASLSFTTPMGGKVNQQIFKMKQKQITMRLGTRNIKLRIDDAIKGIDAVKMANSICPNFVHSIDASHMFRTIELCDEIEDFAMIHDSFGCHASDVDYLVRNLKEAAIEVHSEDLLAKFKNQIAMALPLEWEDRLPPLPERGELDIEEIRNSDFFFS